MACVALLALAVATQSLPVATQTRALAIGYAVLYLGLGTARGRFVAKGWPDYSYGAYIFAFPVMVAIHALRPADGPLVLAGLTFAATLPLAAFSWHLIEKPALDAFRGWRRRVAAAKAA